MRIVLDTNVLVSALLNAHGSPGRVLDGLLLGELRLVCDDRILGEYREVVVRPKFRFDPGHRDRVLEYLAGACERVVAPPMGCALPDPDDRAFLEVAVDAAADALVTGNTRHYPEGVRHGVSVLTPAEFVAEWERVRQRDAERQE